MTALKPKHTHTKKENYHSQENNAFSQPQEKVSLVQLIMQTEKTELFPMILLNIGINVIDTVALFRAMTIKRLSL